MSRPSVSRISSRLGSISLFELIGLVCDNDKRTAGAFEPLGHCNIVRRGLMARVNYHNAEVNKSVNGEKLLHELAPALALCL